jgi:hypothetical protein
MNPDIKVPEELEKPPHLIIIPTNHQAELTKNTRMIIGKTRRRL